MNGPRASIPFAIAAATGMALWFAASLAAGKHEAWDASVYWTVAYPIAIGTCGALGFLFPRQSWRWPVALFFFQFVAMVLRNGEVGNLWPLGLVLFGALSLPGVVTARFGSWLKARSAGKVP